ncbi:tetratricopeptide repeat protein [Sulfuriflexus sp.]|uniref:tetratricopeptide repeat protein n=1 Tax=Sulfuriflexus sp. TaxID=2015443 RepID=UPI0028CF48B0|nr:tetratricopeptide repeat protein [Sulfuriflexus sp.]MDT8403555.1 tetratricopeptide repeat protein [Sulfuriflexus sp.]
MSVINQMLKDLEQRRARDFDGERGMLGDLAAGSSHAAGARSLKLVMALLLVVLVLLAWLLWERFSPVPLRVASVAAQASPDKSVLTTATAPAAVPVEVVSQAESAAVKSESTVAGAVPETPAAEVATANKHMQEIVTADLLPEAEAVARIERITPVDFVANGKRTAMRIYGEGFVPPFDVLLEWSGGRGFKVLDDRQLASVNEHELLLYFNPGTQADDWAVRIERSGGASSQRFAFKVKTPDRKTRETAVPVKVAPQPTVKLSRTRREATPAEQAAGLFATASDKVKAGQAAEAVKLLHEVLVHDAGHSSARELLASLLFHNQQYAEAAAVLATGVEQQPGHIPFRLLLARVRMEQGRDTDAIAVLEGQKPLARNHSDYYALLAALYQRVARPADAAMVYRGLVEVFPGRAVWWMGLGISLQALDKSAEALLAYQQALRGKGLQSELKKFVQQRIRLLGGQAAITD